MITPLLYFILAGVLLIVIILLAARGSTTRADERVSELTTGGQADRLTDVGNRLLGQNLQRRLEEKEKGEAFRDRLMQAGFYGHYSAKIFAVVRSASTVLPLLFGWLAGTFTTLPMTTCLLMGVVVGIGGMLAPSFFLDARKRSRQQVIRRSLPDALDILMVCLEGGMSLSSAFSRVSQELVTAHPELALELAIVDRETRMGRTTGESVRAFADRFDLEELRSMAAVITQAERYGSSVARAMDVFAESLRFKRMQNAETMAQKAVIKVIFPTLLCIFPCLFLVILGPAGISIMKTFARMAEK
jgi:tight adherence protein C